jgi:bifunctional non-homologous end joining protein LigD
MMSSAGMPEWLEPMAATLTQERFTAPDWVFERKFDGIRLLAYKQGTDVRLYSRNRLPQHLPDIAAAVAALPLADVILDGEMTWDGRGAYHVFDILWLDGRDVTALPLEERRALLARLPLAAPMHRVDLIDIPAPWERARREGWEGVIAKRRGSPYEHRRSKFWLKMKCELAQEFVVGGFTDPQGSRVGLGALLIGYYDADDFVFAGKIGTGFDAALLLNLRARLDAIEVTVSPFTKGDGLSRLRVHWVRPEVIVQAGFIEWTAHGKLRHPRLLGLRTDKSPRDVVREDA